MSDTTTLAICTKCHASPVVAVGVALCGDCLQAWVDAERSRREFRTRADIRRRRTRIVRGNDNDQNG